ncbi:hypothetical protein N7452_005231 [Penicillium brevicompactum]|uniref:DUF7136 domain-containing protein n=1 Tax=Penicillium brevicompactum TaxID=5074 RepID=A0A9W9QIA8_PENBR|nr:hypothetical protein N7452_005231 [Penicillium brevicompactum]
MFDMKTRLLAFSLMASLGKAETTGLGLAEVDLIFPRNGTFGPMTLTPIVFAIQNPAAIDRLYPYITYGLWPVDLPPGNQTLNNNLVQHHLPNTTNTTGSTAFLEASIANTLNTENDWEFVWKMDWTNCSTSSNETTSDGEPKPKVNLNNPWAGQSVRFTTKKGASQPNLTALTADDKCGDASALAFNITQTLEAQSGYYEGEKCAVLASPAPTPAPCKVSVAPAAASSISSTLIAAQCAAPTPGISCPPKKGAATVNVVASRLKWWAAGMLLVCELLV